MNLRRPLVALAGATLLLGAAAAAERPKVGLVLGGGGARGAAHIGVLEELERLRVPVDCVAGTSMGALVAGAWAAGLSPAQMRAELAKADWNEMFQDDPEYAELAYRSKRLGQRFLPGSETGLAGLTATAPPGMVSGQKIKLFFNHLVRADAGEREIQQLALPLSIVATDIASGERVVLRDGSLTQAMRASMSVPGLMAPLNYRGRKLVDGGLVDNLPVREVRERCGAEVVIAVNVGSPPLRADQIGGLLSVTAQMVILLTEQNVAASLATLGPRDVDIRPELDPYTSADFAQAGAIADRGRQAAELHELRLAALAVAPADYAAWRSRFIAAEPPALRVDAIEIAGAPGENTAVVQRYLGQQAGQPLDTERLNRDLLRAYGDGYYERVDYTLLTEQGRTLLRVLPVAKSWGPDYLRLGVQLETTLAQGSSFLLRLGYQKTWLNRLGGELLASAELGSSTGLGLEWYQPLTADQRWFASLLGDYHRQRADVFAGDTRTAEYRAGRGRIDLVGGVNLDLVGQARLGWRSLDSRAALETGIAYLPLETPHRASGPLLALDLDRMDRRYFPRRGWATQLAWFDARRGSGAGYSRLQLEGRVAWPWQEWVLAGRASWVDSPRGQLPAIEAGRLGGFLNLSSYAPGQLFGDGVAYAHLRAERIVGTLPLGLRGDMRLGLALEAGRLARPYATPKGDDWLGSLALYLGGETPLGPAYLGLGLGRSGAANVYLFIGTP